MADSTAALEVAAFSGGKDVPSARFRIRQLIPHLAELGVRVREHVPRISMYPPRRRWLRPAWGVSGVMERLPAVIASRSAELVVFQRELMSTLYTVERWSGRPRVLDIDDAVFLLGRGRAARRLAASVDLVVCGNDWLAAHYRRWNDNVIVVPTAVDTLRYVPRTRCRDREQVVIGWSGTGANLHQLVRIEDALRAVLDQRPEVRLRIVSDRPPNLRSIDQRKIQYIPWSREVEVAALQGMDIGLMPLAEDPWVYGKCSYKMLLSMACGLPVVVSPVGMNSQVLEQGDLGLGPRTDQEWVTALLDLVDDPERRSQLGREGRRVARDEYSIDSIAPRIAAAWRHAVDLAG